MSDFRTGVNGEVVIDPNEILGIEQDTDPSEDGVSVLLWPGRWRIRGRSLAGTGPGAVDVSWGAITGKPGTFPPDTHRHPISDVTDWTEATQDVVGSMIVGAGGTYDDAAGTITLPSGGGGGGSSTITADDTPAAPAEGESASYLVTSAVSWPAGLVWSTDPDGGVAPTITGTALVSLFTVGGVTRAIMGATFPAPVVPADTTAPSVPAGLSATAASSTSVTLAWSASTDDTAVTGYEYRVGGGAAVDAGAGLSETVTGLTASTLYSFTVRAYDAAGNRSAWSTAATATTSAAGDTTAPAWSATLTTGTPAATSVVVTASALATDAVGVAGYERSLDGGSTWAAITPSGLNFTLSGLTAATSYPAPQFRAKDAAGNYSAPLAAQAFTTASGGDVTNPTPGTLASSAITSSGFTLTVTGATDETALHATPYAYSTDNGTTWSAWQAGATYNATGLAASTAYQARHKVRDAAGNEETGTAITVATTAASGSLADAILALNPVGYWKLNETTGTQATDYSGNARHGTYGGTYTLAAQDGLLGVEGAGYVDIPDHDDWSVAGSTGLTVFAIGRRDGINGSIHRAIVSKAAASNFEWSLFNPKGTYAMKSDVFNKAATASLMTETTPAVVSLTGWFAHAIVVPTPADGARIIHYHGNGTALATTASGVDGTAIANTTAPLRLGGRGDGLTPWEGGLGHVAIFRSQLTATQIGTLMAAAVAEGLHA